MKKESKKFFVDKGIVLVVFFFVVVPLIIFLLACKNWGDDPKAVVGYLVLIGFAARAIS